MESDPMKLPERLAYDRSSQSITAKDGQMLVADIRGWGHLTGAACKLSEEDAAAVQDAIGKRLVECYNAMPDAECKPIPAFLALATANQRIAELEAELARVMKPGYNQREALREVMIDNAEYRLSASLAREAALREALKNIAEFVPDNEMGNAWNVNAQADIARTALENNNG